MPAHTSHLLQPLDVGLFSPLAHFYKREIEITRSQGIRGIEREDFLRVFEAAREKAFTLSNITSAWRKSGIEPPDPAIVTARLGAHTPPPPEDAYGPRAPNASKKIRSTADVDNAIDIIAELEVTPRKKRALEALAKAVRENLHSGTLEQQLAIGKDPEREKKGVERRMIDITDGGKITRHLVALGQRRQEEKAAEKHQ